MRKLISVLSSAVIAAVSIPFFASSKIVADDSDTIKIMCIGDSITDGYVPEYSGSYRKFIYHGLEKKGYKIDMVGSKDGGYTPSYTDSTTGESFEYDNENTGYSGYAIKAYPGRSGILETLKQTDCLREKKPDVVTLQIGTNNIIDNHNMDENKKDLEELIEYILINIPEDSVLFVSTIPSIEPNREGVRDWFMNYRHSADWQTQYDDATVDANVDKAISDYNTCVEELFSSIKSEHENIVLSDAGSSISDDNKSVLLFDGVHPNNDGYRKIGERWMEILEQYLKGQNPENATQTTTFTETETTTTTTTAATTTVTTEQSQVLPRCQVADLVRLSKYLLGDKESSTFGELFHRYDFYDDDVLDMYDLVLMRKYLLG